METKNDYAIPQIVIPLYPWKAKTLWGSTLYQLKTINEEQKNLYHLFIREKWSPIYPIVLTIEYIFLNSMDGNLGGLT